MASNQQAPLPFDDDARPDGGGALHRLYSVGIGVCRNGTVTVVVGRMGMSTRRYAFANVADSPLRAGPTIPLNELVIMAAQLIANDEEAAAL